MLKSQQVRWAKIVGVLMVACCLALGSGCSDDGGADKGDASDTSDVLDVSTGVDSDPVFSCEDGFRNGDESDVDCGGDDCDPCDLGLQCEQGEDCESGVCTEGVCAAASCDVAGCPNERETCYQGTCTLSCATAGNCGDASAYACTDGACVNLCDAVSCGAGEFCYAGECHANCENYNECLQIKGHLLCEDGVCVTPCDSVTCDAGTQCYRGDCFVECDPNAWDWEEECPSTERAERCINEKGGICVPKDCSLVNCGMNESCYDGKCIGG